MFQARVRKRAPSWGEAILLRIEKQGTIKGDGIPNNWNIKYPHGSIYDPKVQK